MRSIFVGIEYAGKTTLINLLADYYQRRKLSTHWDDHFTIPDSSLSPESQALMVNFPDDVKERFQRMQIQYHIEVIKNHPNTLISGWYIEEAVYSALYGGDPTNPYYEGYLHHHQRFYEAQVLAHHLPDVVLIHVTASDEAIRERIKADPHKYQIIKGDDIPEIKRRFEEEVERSTFTQRGRKTVLDTTGKTPQESFDELLTLTEPLVTPGELAIRALPIPEGDYAVKYENGVRKMIPM
jgi:hypothetical protein